MVKVYERLLLSLVLIVFTIYPLRAQHCSLSTDLVDWAYLGTVNLEADVALARHISITAGMKYNVWDFQAEDPDYIVKDNQKNYYLGFKIWPWVVFDGLWISVVGQYRMFSQTGVWRCKLENGFGYGGVASIGYSWMLTNHLNFEMSSGFRVAKLIDYNLYCCPEHMILLDSGARTQYSLDDIRLAFVFVF